MRGIRVIAKKMGRMGFQSPRFTNYINSLTAEAQKCEGFVCSNSYWDMNKDGLTVSISDWKDNTSWEKWLNSSDRRNIFLDHKESIISEEFMILKKSQRSDDIFLL